MPTRISWATPLQCARNSHQCLQLFACSFFPKQLKAAMPSFRQTGSARNNTPGSHLPAPPPRTWRNSEAFAVCWCALRGIKFQVPSVWFASTPFLAAVPFSHFHVPLQVFSAPPKYTTCTKFLDSGRSYEDLNQDKGFPGLSGKESTCHCSRRGFNPWVGEIPRRRKWQPTPVFWPGKSHGQGSLTGFLP